MARQWTGRDILVALVLTFGVIFAVNGYFIYKAERTYPGEDVAHPYLQGIDYNRTLKDRARQAALGWSATIGATRAADGTATVTVTLRDKEGRPVSNETLKGLFRHPMDEQLDRPIVLKEVKSGTYVGRVAHMRSGSWYVIVDRKTDKETPFEAVRRLWLH